MKYLVIVLILLNISCQNLGQERAVATSEKSDKSPIFRVLFQAEILNHGPFSCPTGFDALTPKFVALDATNKKDATKEFELFCEGVRARTKTIWSECLKSKYDQNSGLFLQELGTPSIDNVRVFDAKFVKRVLPKISHIRLKESYHDFELSCQK